MPLDFVRGSQAIMWNNGEDFEHMPPEVFRASQAIVSLMKQPQVRSTRSQSLRNMSTTLSATWCRKVAHGPETQCRASTRTILEWRSLATALRKSTRLVVTTTARTTSVTVSSFRLRAQNSKAQPLRTK